MKKNLQEVADFLAIFNIKKYKNDVSSGLSPFYFLVFYSFRSSNFPFSEWHSQMTLDQRLFKRLVDSSLGFRSTMTKVNIEKDLQM